MVLTKNGIGTKNLTKILSWKRAIILTKNLDRVMYSCLSMEVMMVNKYCKCKSYISNGFAKKWGGTKNLTKRLSWKRAIILTKHGQSYVLLSVDGCNDGK